jgi:hypothetical protein
MAEGDTGRRVSRNDEAAGDPVPSADGPSRPCPTCGLGVAPGDLRCPRCRTLLVTKCTGACLSCAAHTCLDREKTP